MITEQQATALTQILTMIRPNDWRPQQLLDLFYTHKDTRHPFPAITEAAIKAARNPDIKSPTVIFLDGKHWNHDTPTTRPTNPKCQDHPTQDAHTCTSCWADIKLGQRPESMLGKKTSHGTPNPNGAQQIREALKTMTNNPTPTGSNQETPPSDM